MGERRRVGRYTTAAAPHRGTARTYPCRNPYPCAERERPGLEVHMPLQTKRRDADAFAQPSQETQQRRGQAQPGEIALAYLDEAGVVELHSNRSAWMPRRAHHLIDAPGSKRLSGMAALLNRGSVMNSHCRCSSTAELLPCFVADLVRGVIKPTSSCLTTPRSIAPWPFPELSCTASARCPVQVLAVFEPGAQPYRDDGALDETALAGVQTCGGVLRYLFQEGVLSWKNFSDSICQGPRRNTEFHCGCLF